MKKLIDYGIPWGEKDTGLPYGEFEDRFRHLYVLGKSRSGKSTYFLNLIKQHLDYGMIVVDPAGNMASLVAGMVQDKNRVVYVDRNNPIKINPLDRYGSDWETAATELVEIVDTAVVNTTASERFTVLMKELVRNTIRILDESQKTLEYVRKFLSDPTIQQANSAAMRDEYWHLLLTKAPTGWSRRLDEKRESAVRAGTRMSEFFDTPRMKGFVVGKDQFNPKEIAEQRKVVCFNIHGFAHNQMVFLGNLITHAIKTYYQMLVEGKKYPPLFVFIDEFHLFMSPAFSQMLVECGKFNISLNLSHHTHQQLKWPAELKGVLDAALGTCYTKCVFACGYEEAYRMCLEYRRDIEEFMSLGKYEAMLQIGNETMKIMGYPPPKVEPFIPLPEDDWQDVPWIDPCWSEKANQL